jgi:hypothetical protein
MDRLLSLAVTLALLAAPVVPVFAQQSDAIGAFCPLASRQATADVCMGEPCPCHHGPQSLMSPTGPKARKPEPGPAIVAALYSSTPPCAAEVRHAPGFPAPIHHPPDLHD